MGMWSLCRDRSRSYWGDLLLVPGSKSTRRLKARTIRGNLTLDIQPRQDLIARKIKDPNVLWLWNTIIFSSPATGIRSTLFPGDNLLTKLEHPSGLPIGNQTSQFFANVYMDTLDHFVTERTVGYVARFENPAELFTNAGLLFFVLGLLASQLSAIRMERLRDIADASHDGQSDS